MVAPVRWSSVVVWCGIGVMSWCCSEAATALVVQRREWGSFACDSVSNASLKQRREPVEIRSSCLSTRLSGLVWPKYGLPGYTASFGRGLNVVVVVFVL